MSDTHVGRRVLLVQMAKRFGASDLSLVVHGCMTAVLKGDDIERTVLALARWRPELFGGEKLPILPMLVWPESPSLPLGFNRRATAAEIRAGKYH